MDFLSDYDKQILKAILENKDLFRPIFSKEDEKKYRLSPISHREALREISLCGVVFIEEK